MRRVGRGVEGDRGGLVTGLRAEKIIGKDVGPSGGIEADSFNER